jgi:hypothetical protein
MTAAGGGEAQGGFFWIVPAAAAYRTAGAAPKLQFSALRSRTAALGTRMRTPAAAGQGECDAGVASANCAAIPANRSRERSRIVSG